MTSLTTSVTSHCVVEKTRTVAAARTGGRAERADRTEDLLRRAAETSDELGWVPEVGAPDAVRAFLDGLGRDSDVPTPPLADGTSGTARRHEAATGVGERP